MLKRIRQRFQVAKRRKHVEADLESAYAEIRRYRPLKVYRQREWLREADALDTLHQWLMRADTLAGIDQKAATIPQIVARAKALSENEAHVNTTIDAAAMKVFALRQRAASTLRGSAFQQAERRRRSVEDECAHARRARDSRDEESSLRRLADGLAALESLIDRGEYVNATLPAIEARLATIKPEDIWIDTGSKETYDDILATFGETQNDIKRGDYDKAFQRLREIETLESSLRDRLGRRAGWAVEEVAMWSTSPSVAEAFPDLGQFPKSQMSPADIEQLYALRPAIERFVAARAADQRERNMPVRDATNGRKLAPNHPLHMPLGKASNPADLDEFLRWVTAFGR